MITSGQQRCVYMDTNVRIYVWEIFYMHAIASMVRVRQSKQYSVHALNQIAHVALNLNP